MDVLQNTLFLRAARGEVTERPPIWLMRQAGRSDPAYRALRDSVPLELEELFRTPDLAARISLLPARWNVDALIIFQDILTPLSHMGAPFVFRPGPQLVSPLCDLRDYESLHVFDIEEEMSYVGNTFHLMRQHAGPSVPFLGFAGAPLTLFAFLAEGGSPGHDLIKTRQLLNNHPGLVHKVLDRITKVTTDYLLYQIACGACAVQLFESAAQWFTRQEYVEFALPSQQRIFSAIKDAAPTLFFARLLDAHITLHDLEASGAGILSLPAHYSIRQTRNELGAAKVVQGNLDNRLLVEGPLESIAEAARKCIDEGECRGHIFNLSHGILAETPYEHVLFLVDFVREYGR
jgi:uroporphyrinogen decarboxylase